jgi:uncharacterized membrane protein
MDPSSPASLEDQVLELRTRVLQLEEALRSHGIVAPRAAAPKPAAAALAEPESAVVRTPEPPPQLPYFQTPYSSNAPLNPPTPPAPLTPLRPLDDQPSLESRIGSQWFNRIGILAVLIAMAWFLKMAIDNHWIGPLGRVLIGLISGAGLIAWAERFRDRGYKAFSYSLKALGSGILYLSLWAAFSLFQLVPAGVAFAAMILVTAFNGFTAWIEDAELLALYAIVGGFSTPLLVSTGGNHEVTLFTYLLVMDVAVLVLVALRPWSRLLFGASVGTALFVAGWWFSFYADDQAARTAIFMGLFFLIFAFAPRLVRLVEIDKDDPGRRSAWDNLVLVLLPIANAALGFLAFYFILDSLGAEWAKPWLAVVFAAFYLLLLRLPERGRLHASPAVLTGLHLAAAVVFLTIAIPLKAHGRWLTIGWLTEGAALLWVASRVRSVLLRVLSPLCLILGLISLMLQDQAAAAVVVFNQRFATYCFAIGAFTFVAWLALDGSVDEHDENIEPILRWPALAAASVLVVNLLILVAIGWEIHYYWWLLKWSDDGALRHLHRMYAQFTYSAFFMLFGALLLAVGFWRRSAFLRWQALVLLAATIGKVFLMDISELAEGYRILSFLGLGALLLGVSFVYQRDLLKLRGAGERTA